MSEIESNAPKSTDPSALLGSLLSNPGLLHNISAMLGGGNVVAEEKTEFAPLAQSSNNESVAEGISRVLSNPEMMAKLPDVMKMLAPMVSQPQSQPSQEIQTEKKTEHDRKSCRNDLLVALKPFLSPERCRAIDMLLGLSRLGDALQKMI